MPPLTVRALAWFGALVPVSALVQVSALALAVALVAAPDTARAQPAAAIDDIRIDVSPLRAKGVGNYADILRAALGEALEARLAGRRAADGADLTIVLDTFLMTAYGAGEIDPEGGDLGGMTVDELGGTVVLERGGRVIAREPLRVVAPPARSGPWYTPGFEERRAVTLAGVYADWLARRL